MSPSIRLTILFTLSSISTVGVYLNWPTASAVFASGLSLMLLLPMTFVAMLDVVRDKKISSKNSDSILTKVILSIPLGFIATLSLLIGVYLFFQFFHELQSSTWGNVLVALIAGVVFLGFGIKLCCLLWIRKN